MCLCLYRSAPETAQSPCGAESRARQFAPPLHRRCCEPGEASLGNPQPLRRASSPSIPGIRTPAVSISTPNSHRRVPPKVSFAARRTKGPVGSRVTGHLRMSLSETFEVDPRTGTHAQGGVRPILLPPSVDWRRGEGRTLRKVSICALPKQFWSGTKSPSSHSIGRRGCWQWRRLRLIR